MVRIIFIRWLPSVIIMLQKSSRWKLFMSKIMPKLDNLHTVLFLKKWNAILLYHYFIYTINFLSKSRTQCLKED